MALKYLKYPKRLYDTLKGVDAQRVAAYQFNGRELSERHFVHAGEHRGRSDDRRKSAIFQHGRCCLTPVAIACAGQTELSDLKREKSACITLTQPHAIDRADLFLLEHLAHPAMLFNAQIIKNHSKLSPLSA